MWIILKKERKKQKEKRERGKEKEREKERRGLAKVIETIKSKKCSVRRKRQKTEKVKILQNTVRRTQMCLAGEGKKRMRGKMRQKELDERQ
jgi:hypothetical protein